MTPMSIIGAIIRNEPITWSDFMFKPIRHAIYILFLGFHIHASAETKLMQPIPDSQSLLAGNNNLSASDFFSAWMSKNITEKRYAEMYLLGVFDATEGIAWCDYRLVKTISLEEVVYENMKKLDSTQLQKRASLVITNILKKNLYCRGK
jgi:hypothetical protein